jgi:hypothetical protein
VRVEVPEGEPLAEYPVEDANFTLLDGTGRWEPEGSFFLQQDGLLGAADDCARELMIGTIERYRDCALVFSVSEEAGPLFTLRFRNRWSPFINGSDFAEPSEVSFYAAAG